MVGCSRVIDYVQKQKYGQAIKFPRPISMTEEEARKGVKAIESPEPDGDGDADEEEK